MRWFTSDTHFGHANIIRYSNRPFGGVHHMNETLIENWNRLVGEDDTVYHLGDVALGPWVEWDGVLSRLNGHKVLVIGNHERIFRGEKEKQIERFMPEYKKWFAEIYDNLAIKMDNKIVYLSHFPYDGDSHDEDRYSEYRIRDNGKTPLIHGHTHLDKILSRSKKGTLQVHVGQDAWNYTPVSEEQVINALNLDTP